MDKLTEQLHRTFVQLLIENDYREIAAIAIDSTLDILYSGFDPDCIAVNVPTSIYTMVKNNDHIKKVIERALLSVCEGRITDQNGNPLGNLSVIYRIQLLDIEEGWQNVIKSLIANAENPNQALITEKAFSKTNKQPYLYNEMKFASKSEIRIAQEFESRKILFFPLPLAVRADTGNFYEDHREVDFLVCEDGAWGILEVSYHPDRYEKDVEKDSWLKKSGILCVQHYTAERCYSNPAEVVKEFMSILAKHRKR
jgi:hypothetical protein